MSPPSALYWISCIFMSLIYCLTLLVTIVVSLGLTSVMLYSFFGALLHAAKIATIAKEKTVIFVRFIYYSSFYVRLIIHKKVIQ